MLNEAQQKMAAKYLGGDLPCEDEKTAKTICDALLMLRLDEIPSLLLKYKAVCEVTKGNIPQYSDLTVALYMVPQKLCAASAPLSYEELGASIYPCRSIGAAGKYGEGHGKLAVLIGLAQCKKTEGKQQFILTAMGCYFCKLQQEDKDNLLQRLCYKVPIVQHMVTQKEPIKTLEKCLSILSESTQKRRYRNVLDVYAFAIDA